MTAILELPEVRRRVSHLSVEEYHRLDEFNENGKRTELIRGIVIEKMSKSPLHATIATRLFKLILPVLPSDFTARLEQPLTLADSEPEPDVSVIRGSDADFKEAHPSTASLVVEVAVSSLELDREIATLYAEAEVEEYWIILGYEKAVEVYRRPVAGVYQEKTTVKMDETLTCGSVPGLAIPLHEIFA
ncbi:MAG: Uma2 family endonuclease [Chthoniobacter sp.]|nr:Uma2 family endonuclease [Chthoniobacter sp.]